MTAPRLVTISISIKLNVRPLTVTRLSDIVVFAAISPAPSNLSADSMASAGRPFRKGYWLAMAAPRPGSIIKYIKLNVRQVIAIKSNYIVVFAVISPAPSNLGADSMAPAGRPFRKSYWPPDPRPTIRIDGRGRGLSVEPSIATNANG